MTDPVDELLEKINEYALAFLTKCGALQFLNDLQTGIDTIAEDFEWGSSQDPSDSSDSTQKG